MSGGSLDATDGVLQIVERASTARTGDVLGLRKLDAGGLQDSVSQHHSLLLSQERRRDNQFCCLAVDEQGPNGHCCLELQLLHVRSIQLKTDGVVADGGLRFAAQARTLRDEVYQLSGNRNLTFRLLGERHANRIADTFREQCSDAHSTLDASVLALASLSHTEMQRVVHVFAVHCLDEQPHRLYHHHRIACLDGDDHIRKVLTAEDAQELHATLNDAGRRVAVT